MIIRKAIAGTMCWTITHEGKEYVIIGSSLPDDEVDLIFREHVYKANLHSYETSTDYERLMVEARYLYKNFDHAARGVLKDLEEYILEVII